ncbi:G-protein coupled receptor Mth2 isoform X4 [Dendroctonus ponderosae]|uniref:G-protein coupled receptors family 2 profile 2 domain-containing protein n=1 Tax=Dendroctonus ponderosae TaxID=77166 RepID=A0AAR5PP32_DENPD|nr:G-protein coupled receptor Mth2 isoform X4 [Dendroctonus ponderosae]
MRFGNVFAASIIARNPQESASLSSCKRLNMSVLVLALVSAFVSVSAGSEQFSLRKCCAFNKLFNSSTSQCILHKNGASSMEVFQYELLNFNANLSNTNWTPSNGTMCLSGYSATAATDGNHIEDGVLIDPEFGRISSDRFCLEVSTNNFSQYEVLTLVCESTNPGPAKVVADLGMIISMPFLLITFLVYALLPDRNLHQRALMFYVLSLLIAYILLVTINLAPNIPTWFWCKFLGYSTLFFFMVSFFWMNVICFDIWYTFSGGRGFMGSKRTSERRRLIFYSLYANGVPLLIVAWTYGMQISLPNECEHNPGIGVAKCFLATGWASLWYFYLEAGIVVIANITFFILTALRIRKVKQETSMLKHNDSKRHTYEKDKQKFNLYVKLLFAMGVNWSMEVISWLVNWNTKSEYQYIWYATDFFNAVYGVFIFFIFVFKKKIWTLLQRRYYNFIGRPHLAHTVTSSNTRSSHYSSTNYSTADTGLSERATAVNGRQPAEEMALRRVT